jgi:peroxiredoxin
MYKLMMRKLFLLLSFLGLAACNKDQVRISGRISNAENMVLHLDEVDVYDTKSADSIKLKKNGKFSFTFKTAVPCFYQLRLSSDKIIVLFPEPGQHINVVANANNMLSSLEIDGSNATEQITKLIRLLNEATADLDSLDALYNVAESDSVRERLNKEYRQVLERHRKYSITFILTHYNSLASLYALYQQYKPGSYVFYKITDMQFFKIVSDSLSKYHPDLKHVKALKAYTDNMILKYKTQSLIKEAEKSEVSLPEIALPDFTGDTITLKSLKGRYVLLSFWASYDEYSVKQNLELKKIYNQYKGKGFEIMQVSFDNSVDAWRNAVRFDELPWINVIDTEYPNSIIAGSFNVKEIPSNYLIDKDNVSILAKNLTTNQLQLKLQDIFN